MTDGAIRLPHTDETVSADDNQRLCDHERLRLMFESLHLPTLRPQVDLVKFNLPGHGGKYSKTWLELKSGLYARRTRRPIVRWVYSRNSLKSTRIYKIHYDYYVTIFCNPYDRFYHPRVPLNPLVAESTGTSIKK